MSEDRTIIERISLDIQVSFHGWDTPGLVPDTTWERGAVDDMPDGAIRIRYRAADGTVYGVTIAALSDDEGASDG